MTVMQVMSAAQQAIFTNRYLAMRDRKGFVFGYNPRIAKLDIMLGKYEPEKESIFQSFRLITFQEYISIKKPFL